MVTDVVYGMWLLSSLMIFRDADPSRSGCGLMAHPIHTAAEECSLEEAMRVAERDPLLVHMLSLDRWCMLDSMDLERAGRKW